MAARGIIIVLVFCTACMGGKIPCPKVKEAKLRKHYRPSASALYARAEREKEVAETQKPQTAKPVDAKFEKNVSVEEWDCPQPGAKKYKPKDVKENIRRNMEKIRSDLKKQQNEADSVSTK